MSKSREPHVVYPAGRLYGVAIELSEAPDPATLRVRARVTESDPPGADLPASAYTIDGTTLTLLDCVNYDPRTLAISWGADAAPPATPPVASFTATPTSGNAPLTVAFTDTSTGAPTSWRWDFGDGVVSTAQNPSHSYAAAGTYTVTLTVGNAAASSTSRQSNLVDVTAPAGSPPTAAFTATPTSGTWPRTVTFTDTSTGTPNAWAWDFGDGATSTARNPSHQYANPGTYTVTLTATNAAGSNTSTRTGLITITSWNPNTMLGADGVHPNDTGMTFLADTYVAALKSAAKTPAAGTATYAYGDSWTARDTYNAPGNRAIDQLASRLGLTLTNRAVGGYKIGDIATHAIGTAGTFVAGTSGLVVVANAGLNDLLLSDTTAQRTASSNYLRALFAALCAAERIEQGAFTTPGGWTTNSAALWSGGSNAQTNTEGNTASYNITTPGTYYLLAAGTDGSSLIGGKLTVSQGGTTLATLDLNAQATQTGNTLISTYGPLSVRVPNVQAGALTVTYTAAGRSSAWGFLDALVRISPTPPTILAVKPIRVLSAQTQKPALLDYIRQQYDAMAAEFGANVVVCDPDPGWTP